MITYSRFHNHIPHNLFLFLHTLSLLLHRLKGTYTPEVKKVTHSIFGAGEHGSGSGSGGEDDKKKKNKKKHGVGADGEIEPGMGGCACTIM